jgi:hypothetical protein
VEEDPDLAVQLDALLAAGASEEMKTAKHTGSSVSEPTEPSASHIFAQPSSATFNIQDVLAAAQRMSCETSGSTDFGNDPELAADIVSLVAAAKAEQTAKHDAELAASVAADDARAALNVCLQPQSAALIAIAASDAVKIAKDTADDEAEKAANAMVAVSTPGFRDNWHLLSAFEARFAQMKLIAIEGDNLEIALFVKKALVVVDQLNALKTLTVETIVAELKPYNILFGKELDTFLFSLMQKSITHEDSILALLGDLSAEFEQGKKRAVSNDDLEMARAIKHAATVVAHLQSHPSSANSVLLALEAHIKVIGEEWHARMHSLSPSTSLEGGSPLKRSLKA